MKTAEVTEDGWYKIEGTDLQRKFKFEGILYVVGKRIVSGEWHRVTAKDRDSGVITHDMHPIRPEFIGLHLSDYTECEPTGFDADWEWTLK